MAASKDDGKVNHEISKLEKGLRERWQMGLHPMTQMGVCGQLANERNGVGVGVANGITHSNRALSGELLYDTQATTDTDRYGR